MITKAQIHEVENATVRDRDGASVGKVAQVFPSDEDGSAAFISVATGLLGSHAVLVPVEDATFDGSDLHVGYTKRAIKDAPSAGTGAGNTLSLADENAARKHFGLSPAGKATGDMGDPHENLDQAGTGPAGADDTEGAGTTPPA
ncbi:PRC-barrel domain-containing protein [Curtobacterium citreum]